ncbi:MAG: hypothetical protein ACRD2O_10315 [Terriglobia bacterium]
MQNKIKNSINSAALVLCAAMLTAAAAVAQAQNATPPQLTDAQARALVQTFMAQAQASGQNPLTPEQARLLTQYLMFQSQAGAASPAVSAAQAQALAQAFASQGVSPVAPGAAQAVPQPAAAASASLSVAPKKPGVVRIGVVEPKAQMGQGNSGANVAEPLRAMIVQYLGGPAIEVLPIAAMLPSQIEAEGKAKDCDYLVYSSISEQTKSGPMGFLKKAGPLAQMTSMIPIVGGMASMSGAMAGAAASTAISGAASIASTVKAKSEVTFDYKLMIPGNTTPVLANTVKAKARQDGEDVVTPLIEQAATAIVAEITKKK